VTGQSAYTVSKPLQSTDCITCTSVSAAAECVTLRICYCRGVKDTRTPLNAAIGAALTHITLTPLFILGEE
jgi:Na+-driven multidrug efflux pump